MTTSPFSKSNNAPTGTVLSSGLRVEGELTGSEALTIEGTFSGQIQTEAAVNIGSSANVEANISATSVKIEGSVAGNVVASERLDISEGGKLLGDLRAARISIADGAVFRGHVEMDF